MIIAKQVAESAPMRCAVKLNLHLNTQTTTLVHFVSREISSSLCGMVYAMSRSFENSTQSNWTAEAACIPFAQDDAICVKVIKTACFSIVMLLSLLGNSAIIAIVSKNRHMQTTTNYLIANMAVSDLILSAFAVPRELTEIFMGYRAWLIGGSAGVVLCKLVYFIQDVSTAVSIQSIVVITIDRYTGVVTPFRKPLITARRLRVVILIIWLLAMALHGPYFYNARLQRVQNAIVCFFTWEPAFDNLQAHRTYFIIISASLIAIPLAAITLLYSLIFKAIKRQKSFWRTVSSFGQRRRKEDTRITKKIIAIIVLFVVCILPIDILGFLYLFAWQEKIPCGVDNVSFAAKFIFYSNASLNPCVYFLFNERYRQGLRTILKCRQNSRREGLCRCSLVKFKPEN